MFNRVVVNKQGLKEQKLVFLPTKVEHDEKSNEIWLFGSTPQFQTVLIRVQKFDSVFYVEDQKTSMIDEQNKLAQLSLLIKQFFKTNNPNITLHSQKEKTLFKIVLDHSSLSQANILSTLKDAKLEDKELFSSACIFVPKTKDQFLMQHGINSKTLLEISLDDEEKNILLAESEEEEKTQLKGKKISQRQKISTCQIEIISNEFQPNKQINQKLSQNIYDNQIILITDIENLVIENGFEAEKIKKNPIFMISNLIFRNGQRVCMKQIFTTSKKMEIDSNVDVKYFDNELDMLLAWARELDHIDPDIISGYNVFKFDMNFIFLRTKFLIEDQHSNNPLINFGRIPHQELSEEISSNFFTNKSYFYLKEDIEIIEPSGRLVIDGSWYFNHSHPFVPLTQRKLKDWAKKYLNDDSQKLDIPYNEFADYLYSEDIKKRSLLGEYNIRDSEIVQELILKFGIVHYYSDQSYLNDSLIQDSHDKNLFPRYWKRINEIKEYSQSIEFSNGCLVIKNNQEEQWNKIESFLSHLDSLSKVEFDIDSQTSPLIFKQITKMQSYLKLENISLKLNESITDIPFKLNSIIQFLDANLIKNVSIETKAETKNQQIDLFESLINLPPSLSYLNISLHSTTQLISSEKINEQLKGLKATQIKKIVFNLNDFQEQKLEFTEFIGQFVKQQDQLELVDLNFSYDSTNQQFIQNVVKSVATNSNQLKILNLSIKGNNAIKSSFDVKQKKSSTELLESVLRILETSLVCIEKLFFNYLDIFLYSLDDKIFSSFPIRLTTLKLIFFKIEEEKKFLKSNFYQMIKLLKSRQ